VSTATIEKVSCAAIAESHIPLVNAKGSNNFSWEEVFGKA